MRGLTLADPALLGVNRGFSPLSLNPLIWLDAADLTTITQSSGSVSAWADKSGNGFNVTQGNGANQPTTGTRTQNSLNVIDFDGSNDFLQSAATISQFRASRAVTVLVAVKSDRTSAASEGILGARSDNPDYTTGWVLERRTTFLAYSIGNGGTNASPSNYNAARFSNSSTSPLLFATDTSAAANTTNAFVNNVAQTLTTFDGTMAPSSFLGSGSGNHRIDIGARFLPNLGQPFDGWIGEILIFDRQLSQIDRDAASTYLAAKWAL